MTAIRVIHKYWLAPEIPVGGNGRIIKVGLDAYGTPCLWAIVDPQLVSEIRHFVIVGTGWGFKDGDYLGSFWQDRYCWHLFETTSYSKTAAEEIYWKEYYITTGNK